MTYILDWCSAHNPTNKIKQFHSLYKHTSEYLGLAYHLIGIMFRFKIEIEGRFTLSPINILRSYQILHLFS